MSRRIINGSITIVVLLLFVFSTMPLLTKQGGNSGDLRSAISHIQDLTRQADSLKQDFKIVLTHTLSSLQNAAELNTILTLAENSSKEKKTTITISIRLPYLLAKNYTIEGARFYTDLLPSSLSPIYKSYIT